MKLLQEPFLMTGDFFSTFAASVEALSNSRHCLQQCDLSNEKCGCHGDLHLMSDLHCKSERETLMGLAHEKNNK